MCGKWIQVWAVMKSMWNFNVLNSNIVLNQSDLYFISQDSKVPPWKLNTQNNEVSQRVSSCCQFYSVTNLDENRLRLKRRRWKLLWDCPKGLNAGLVCCCPAAYKLFCSMSLGWTSTERASWKYMLWRYGSRRSDKSFKVCYKLRHLRTGSVLKTSAGLFSPSPFPLIADNFTS